MFDMQEAVAYYKKQGAPADQTALVNLLKEVQAQFGGIDPAHITQAAELLGTKESLLLALVRRMPWLRLPDGGAAVQGKGRDPALHRLSAHVRQRAECEAGRRASPQSR